MRETGGVLQLRSQVQALKQYGMQSSLDMTLEIRSQVKGHSRYELKIFRKDVKLLKS